MRRLALLALVAASVAAAGAERPVVIRLDPVGGGSPPAKGSLHLQSVDGQGRALSVPLTESGHGGAKLPAGSRWVVDAHVPGWWMNREALYVEDGAGPLVVQRLAWPTRRLHRGVASQGKTPRPP